MNQFVLVPSGAFALATSVSFLEAFMEGAFTWRHDAKSRALEIAIRLDDTFEAVGVRLSQDKQGRLIGEITGENAHDVERDAVAEQVARMFGLDVDGKDFAKIDKRDRILGKLLAKHPGFRPVSFPSPYECAVWSILGEELVPKHAATARKKIARELGDEIRLGEGKKADALYALPAPATLAGAKRVEGISESAWKRLRAVARAADEGALDAEHLRSHSPEDALLELAHIRGVTKFPAGNVLLRATGAVDLIALSEPQFLAAFERFFGKDLPAEDVFAITQRWQPYRTWGVALLVFAAKVTSLVSKTPAKAAPKKATKAVSKKPAKAVSKKPAKKTLKGPTKKP